MRVTIAVMPEPINFSTDVDVDVPLHKLWPLVSDTDRLNRAVGLPHVEYETTPSPTGGSIRHASARFGPVPMKWREMPFEWVKHEGFEVERLFPGGPIERVIAGCTLSALGDDRTRVGIYGKFFPRNVVGVLASRLMGRKSLADLTRQVRHFESCEKGKSKALFARSRGKSPLNEEALLDAAMKINHELKRRILGRFLEYLKDAYDEELIRIRPFALADRWGENRLDVLRTFLSATQVGIVDLRWVPICPHCRGAKGEIPTLADLKNLGYCESCNLSFELNFDEAVEVRFTVNPNIRPTIDSIYCIGGPANTTHVHAQARIKPGETRTLSVALPPNRYRMRSPQVADIATIEWSPDAPMTKNLLMARDGQLLPQGLLFSGDRAEVTVTNELPVEMLFVIEDEAWEEKAASAALVTSLQDFRELFDAEVLSGETDLAIKSMAIMFSDLKSSTELYEKVGDARAYALVREHFVFMGECIANNNGAIVKTIGDAVMAVFSRARDAVSTCLEIQERIKDFNRRENLASAITLKLGAHKGPVIAVNSNDRLDYFGGTVNFAARLHGESDGGDVILSSAMVEDPNVAVILRDRKLVPETFSAALKGISGEQEIHRIRVK